MAKETRIQDMYNLSPMQSGMLFHSLVNKESDAYFEQTVFSLKGNIDRFLLEAAFNQLIERYDVLRTVFSYEKIKKNLQIVLKSRKFVMKFEDLSHMKEEEKEKYLNQFKQEDRTRGFDLTRDLLIRISLFKTGTHNWKLVWSSHHILMDGWCLSMIFGDLMQIYQGLKGHRPIELAPVKPYKHYIQWLEKQDTDEGLDYWTRYLENYEQPATVPASWNPSKDNTYELKNEHLIIHESLTLGLTQLAQTKLTTINTVFQALWGILLQRYNNTNDVVFGAVVSGRPPQIDGVETMVGLFINTIPIRIKTGPGTSFSELLEILQKEAGLTKPYEYLPLVEIQSRSELKSKLLDHIMVFKNLPFREEAKAIGSGPAPDFIIQDVETFEQTNYDLNLLVEPGPACTINFSYNSRVYDSEFVKHIGRHFHRMVRQVLENPDAKPGEIEILTESQKKQLLVDFNETTAPYPQDKTLHDMFASQAAKTSDRIAIVGNSLFNLRAHPHTGDQHLSYRQLQQKSQQWAGILKEKGITSSNIAAIFMERSLEMVIGILGILTAGAAYLPIEPACPVHRLRYIIKDSSAVLILTQRQLAPLVKGTVPALYAEDIDVSRENKRPVEKPGILAPLAYIIYTSGSTGKPKGVMINHPSLINILLALQEVYPLDEPDAFLFKTPYIFDVSLTELGGWFWAGGRLVILEAGGEKNPQAILEAISRNYVTHINFVPSMFSVFVDAIAPQDQEMLSSLKYIFLAGEAILPQWIKTFRRLNSAIALENIYGPTEATIYAARYSLREWDDRGNIPIGKPLKNEKLYILGNNYRVQPVGIPGELHISGDCLARGYLNRPELTAEKFNHDGRHRSARSYESYVLYKTGDLARWMPDGNVEFLGRIDHQVKIRGFRIELGEIENQILQDKEVKEAVVVVKEDESGDRFLCAYIVTHLSNPTMVENFDISRLRENLSRLIPGYMIPQYFVPVERIPLNPSGKIDRAALPLPKPTAGDEYTEPVTETEKKLTHIWAEILDIEYDTIGRNTGFFQLGGHSLKAILLLSRIHKEFNVNVPLAKVFELSTIKRLSGYVKKARKEKFVSIEPVQKKEYYPLSSPQKRIYFLQQMNLESTAYNISEVVVLEGEPERERLGFTFAKLIERHESLKTSFKIVEGEPFQKVHDKVEFMIQYHDAGMEVLKGSTKDNQQQVRRLIDNFVRPFNLSKPPLLRVGTIITDERKYILIVDIHHIISDGFSIEILVKDFMTIYEKKELPVLKLQYKDYSEWHHRFKDSKEMKKQEAYWIKIFEDKVPRLNFPTDYTAPATKSVEGNSILFEIDKELTAKIRKLVLETGTTLSIVLLTVYYILLSKYTGAEDIVVGIPIAERSHVDLQNIIGMFANMLAVRSRPQANKTFGKFLTEVKEHSINAYENQDYQYEELVWTLGKQVEPGIYSLEETVFTMQNKADGDARFEHLKVTSYQFDREIEAHYALYLVGIELPHTLNMKLVYSKALLEKSTMERVAERYIEILKQVMENKDIKLKDIKISHSLEDSEANILQIDFGF